MEQLPYAEFLDSNPYEHGGTQFYGGDNAIFDDIGRALETQSHQIATAVSENSNLFIFPKDVLYNENPPSPRPDPTWLETLINEADNTTIENTQCRFLGCQDRRVFKDKSSLQRHLDKHSRPYNCQDSTCHGQDFGDKGGLHRHEKEVHGMHRPKSYLCPIRSCKRHSRGFPRKYNLFEHQKRCHPSQSVSTLTASRMPVDLGKDTQEYAAHDTDEDVAVKNVVTAGREVIDNSTCEELRVKLQKLLVVRTEIDSDIATLENALGIMENVSLP